MTGAIHEVRVELAELLGEDVKPYPPAKLGPGGFISPGDPWIETGDTFGSFRIRFDIVLVVRAVNNETAMTEITDKVEAAVETLTDEVWRVAEIGAPRALSQEGDNVKYLAAYITATKPLSGL